MPLDLVGLTEESTVRIEPHRRMSSQEFFDFCQANDAWRIEKTADGEIIVMPPTGLETGNWNFEIILQLGAWTKRDGRGKAFDSNTGFELPNGSMRSPDAAWMSRSMWATLTSEQRKVFGPCCPEFVIELKSPSDSLPALKRKMLEWIDNGAQLAWLIVPDTRTVFVYRAGREPEAMHNIDRIAGESPVDGFVLDLAEVWEPD